MRRKGKGKKEKEKKRAIQETRKGVMKGGRAANIAFKAAEGKDID